MCDPDQDIINIIKDDSPVIKRQNYELTGDFCVFWRIIVLLLYLLDLLELSICIDAAHDGSTIPASFVRVLPRPYREPWTKLASDC